VKLSTDLAPCKESHPGYDITDAEWEFMKAIEAYKHRFRRRFPTWREVLHVARCLGYRRIAKATDLDKLPVDLDEPPPSREALASLDRERSQQATESCVFDANQAP